MVTLLTPHAGGPVRAATRNDAGGHGPDRRAREWVVVVENRIARGLCSLEGPDGRPALPPSDPNMT